MSDTATGYADAAPLYRAAGWRDDVGSVMPLPADAKWPPPKNYTGASGSWPNDAQIARWCKAHPDGNIALRLGKTVIGIDIDAYKNRAARRQLEAKLKVKLPPTWTSTSRTDGSGILLYRVPPPPKGRRWKSKPVDGVEICQLRHRYVTCWPSIHDEGRVYFWLEPSGEKAEDGRVPELDDLTFLPLKAVDPLLEDIPELASRDAVDFDLTGGTPSPSVARLLQQGVDVCANGQGRHDGVLPVVLSLVRAAEQGAPGVGPAVEELRSAFIAAVGPDRPKAEGQAASEFDSMLTGARTRVATTEAPEPRPEAGSDGRPTPEAPVLDDGFWNERKSLLRVCQAAHAQQCSAAFLLEVVLARVAAAVPCGLQLPAPLGAPRPLSLFVAGVAPSGVGKTAVNDNARSFFPIAIPTVADQLPLGSGEGLVEAFFDWVEEEDADGKTRVVKKQTKYGAYYYVDEGQVLADLGNRKGATLLPTIRAMFSGAQIGSTNAARDTRRLVNPGWYTVGLVVAIQPRLAGTLLDDSDAGTPQRFLWGHAADPRIPDKPTTWPTPTEWEPPSTKALKGLRTVDRFGGGHLHVMDVAQPILDEIREAGLARARGAATLDELDAHAGLVRFKVAGNLAILERRTNITADDWRLAHAVMGYSDTVRTGVLGELREADREREDATTARAARRHVGVVTAEEHHRVVEGAKRIAPKVRDDGAQTRKDLYSTLKRWRDVFDDALAYALEKGWVVEDDEPGQGTDRRVIRAGRRGRHEGVDRGWTSTPYLAFSRVLQRARTLSRQPFPSRRNVRQSAN